MREITSIFNHKPFKKYSTKNNSGDAFYFDQDELFVQITVGASHPVKGNGLDNICALFRRNRWEFRHFQPLFSVCVV
jgi:hypothetical protein